MTITNNGREADRLTGGTLAQAGRFEVHEMTMVDNVMRMRQLAQGLEIKAGATVKLEPGGYHIMGLDLASGYTQGQTIKGTLVFEKSRDSSDRVHRRPHRGRGVAIAITEDGRVRPSSILWRALPRNFVRLAGDVRLLARVLGGAGLGLGFGVVDRPERLGIGHGDDVVAGIHEVDVAGDAGRQVGEEIERGAADLFDRYRAAQRRVALLEIEHQPGVGDA